MSRESFESRGTTGRIGRLCAALRRHGIRDTLVLLALAIYTGPLLRPLRQAVWRWRDRAYDRRHGTDTSGEIRFEALQIDSANKIHGFWYRATPKPVFDGLMKTVDADLRDYSFVDFGCGKGRVLLFAAELPFRQVIGVEFAPELAEIARANAARRFGPDQDRIRVLTQDVADFVIPPGPCVLFFYTPFLIEVTEMVARMIEREVKASPRPVWVVWYNVVHSTTPFYRMDWLEPVHGRKAPPGVGAPEPFAVAAGITIPSVVFRVKTAVN